MWATTYSTDSITRRYKTEASTYIACTTNIDYTSSTASTEYTAYTTSTAYAANAGVDFETIYPTPASLGACFRHQGRS